MLGSPTRPLFARDTNTDEFVKLISDPFSSQLQQDAFIASLITSLGVSFAIALVFCFLRPFNSVVYAPRLRHADQKHAPPSIGKGIFAWVKPVIKTKEDTLAEMIGLDATVFLRFTKMCRNIFSVLTILGCAIVIPMNVVGGHQFVKQINNGNITAFTKMTPQFLFGKVFWGFVVCAYVFDVVCCVFLWWNYKEVARLRKNYFNSYEYQNSLHSRTLMITNIPKSLRSDEGIVKIVDEVKNTPSLPRAAIGRNVKDIPELIEEHDDAVKKLEKVLAKYLKNPDNLGARPLCSPSKKDKSYSGKEKENVDAIDYLTTRIKYLEREIRETRETVDKRNAMSYGFASYKTIDEAHGVAYLARNKHPEGTNVRLAPKPNDLIWKNLPMTSQERRWQRLMNNLWMALLTLLWVAPNALIAVFLANLSNLGKVWGAFQTELNAHSKSWAAVQGILSPAITSLFYFYLPIFFRRLSMRAGDLSKTSRERHVVAKLYSFFVFNNLVVFSLFAAVWQYVAAVLQARKDDPDIFHALKKADFLDKFFPALCNVSPFWITWLLQRNLGAAIDLSQIVNLAWGSISRKFKSPTPREMIELTAPPPFDYSSYYNYFLFYSTIALCFGTLQPIVFPVTALYFAIDSGLKKYLLMYVFITKTESGGQFWRILFNRFIFAMLMSNIIIALMIAAKAGDVLRIPMLATMAPIPFLLAGFKWYCSSQFDDVIHYYNKGQFQNPEAQALPDKKARHGDSVGVRYGHPALYKSIMTPMVHAKAKNVLSQLYDGRLDQDDAASIAGYSDTYSLKPMARANVGRAPDSSAPFELVTEGQLDFENFKNRPEFREEFGGDGEVYGKPTDLVRPDTPASFMAGERGRSSSRESDRTFTATSETDVDGTTYPAGYHSTPDVRNSSPDRRAFGSGAQTGTRPSDASETNLLRGAAPMGTAVAASSSRTGSPVQTPKTGDMSYDYFRTGRK